MEKIDFPQTCAVLLAISCTFAWPKRKNCFDRCRNATKSKITMIMRFTRKLNITAMRWRINARIPIVFLHWSSTKPPLSITVSKWACLLKRLFIYPHDTILNSNTSLEKFMILNTFRQVKMMNKGGSECIEKKSWNWKAT